MALSYVTEVVTTEGLIRAVGDYSLAVVDEQGGARVALQTGRIPDGGMETGVYDQTGRALWRIGAILKEVGCDYRRVTMVNVWLADVALRGEFSDAYGGFMREVLGEGPYPARQVLRGSVVTNPEALVGIAVEAYLPPTPNS